MSQRTSSGLLVFIFFFHTELNKGKEKHQNDIMDLRPDSTSQKENQRYEAQYYPPLNEKERRRFTTWYFGGPCIIALLLSSLFTPTHDS
jgi:hypothetical protein